MQINTGRAYKRMAEENGHSQRKVAGICAVSANTASRWFRSSDQSLQLIAENCRKLGWDFDDFMSHATGRKS